MIESSQTEPSAINLESDLLLDICNYPISLCSGNYQQGDEYNQLGARLDELKIEVDDDVEEGGGGTFIDAVSHLCPAPPYAMLHL